ncbi:TPA: hypothetical protein ACN359_004533 [Vibrio parahaemolyticus]|uniref:hypothetical protein n=1 Tax=Vibrio parahaemolyticus TaxID=670 RepID=UPI0010E812ED|nr:hypothetical protein [Vibrio parahaemolyticus]MBM4973469.1 hypothetical protein [Vibrio parahaemolyticus]MBM5009845.1 hypothetical protein [Vibrio parahaemolyticus]MCQ9081326.1 hypothetical protein [Vibrio parahaemolyticus]TBT46860.1 hypothetical protein D5E75_24735 [Vibrio parahaemolyticus]TOF54157.1 hypothetical protein CGJ20_23880 [Vibrio parahaemolyticus]
MELKLKSIADKGNFEKERLLIEATVSCDLGEFLLLRTGLSDGVVTTEVKNTLWFPDVELRKGDSVVVYTKSGRNNVKKIESGNNVYFQYWGLDEPIWNNDNTAPVLMNAPEWDSSLPSEL